MDRTNQIQAIVHFVNDHPESLASLVIRRRARGSDPERDAPGALEQHLDALDEETLTGYYYLVR